MADKVSVAIRQEQALNRLNTAAAQLAQHLGVEAPHLPTRGHDREILRAQQFEALAAWVEALAENVGTAGVAEIEPDSTPVDAPAEGDAGTTPYDDLSKADLVLEFQRRGMDVESVTGSGANGNILKVDLVAALMAHDAGEEQADG